MTQQDDYLMLGAKPLLNMLAQRATFMGIDASLTATGVAVITAGQVKSFVLTPPKDQNRGVARLLWFRQQFIRLIHSYNPQDVAIEGYSFGSMNKREALGELGGILRLSVWEAFDKKKEVWEIPPSSLKAFATGAGNASKDVVMKEAFKRWGVDVSDNNECDACVLAIMALARHLGYDRASLTQFQATSLRKLEV